ncbi:amino acid adenylation domain-containing protein [Streptomyces sp. NPDC005438]|uniref:amino acid adenylation domain-containing protein n=1 Tax=Streptomyces sp. NPDC005438 TaxID=3156880 RepID=UPI0033AFB85C
MHTTDRRGRTIPDLFAVTAAQRGDAPAVTDGTTELSYAELAAEGARLARWLIGERVGPGSTVGVAVPRSTEAVVVWLAVLQAGASYFWIDVDYPAERVAHMVEVADPSLVLTTAETTDRLAPHLGGRRGVGLDAIEGEVRSQPSASVTDDDRTLPLSADDTAYTIFTSGSTGAPKGVAVTHAGIGSLVDTAAERLGITEESVVTQFASMSFDVSVWELCMSLLLGGRCVVVPAELRAPDRAFVDFLRAHGVTASAIPPAFLRYLNEHSSLLQDVAVFTGADRVHTDLVDHWTRRGPVVTAYGVTEATVNSTLWRARSGYEGTAAPIGLPDPGTTVHILDANLSEVPPGEVGELYLGGDGLARGYLRNTPLTGSRFVANPFGAPGSRMYRTGDQVALDPEGNVLFLGRVDDQIKVRGFRVEPGEVESALEDVPEVEQAVVVAVPDSYGEAQLVAYLRTVDGRDPDEAELRRTAAKRIPGYMLPSRLLCVDSFPVAVTGKVDRKALASREIPSGAPAPSPYPEHGSLAGELCALFAEVLGQASFSGEENFFARGGHSLLATRLLGQIRERYRREVSWRVFYGSPTPAGLARTMASCPITPASDPTRSAASRPEEIPLAPAQRGLWLLNRDSLGADSYQVTVGIRLSGPVDEKDLRLAWTNTVRRHEILRTVFPEVSGTPVQRVWPVDDGSVRFETVEYSAERLYQAARHSFDLTAEVPARVTFLRSARESLLLFVFHHIAVDEWSIAVLLADFRTAYATVIGDTGTGHHSGEPLPPPTQYADFTVWHQARMGGPDDPGSEMARQLEYWKEELADLPEEIPMATGDDRTSTETASAGTRLPAEVAEGLRGVAVRENCSVFMVVHAALVAVLARHGAGGDVVVGCPTSGRGDASVERTVGYFVNPVVLRVRVPVGVSLRELLPRVVAVDIEAFERAEVPFERVVEAVNPRRVAGRNPLFQISLTQTYPESAVPDLPGLDTEWADIPTDSVPYDLAFSFNELSDSPGLGLAARFRTGLYDRHRVEQLLEDLATTLTDLARGSTAPIPVEVAAARQASPPAQVPHLDPSVDPRVVDLLRDMFGEVLDRAPVPATANFFDLGGHSLLAVRLIGRVRERFSCQVSLSSLFQAPTPVELAGLLRIPAWPPAPKRLSPESRDEHSGRDVFPLAPGQRGLWWLEREPGTSGVYNVGVCVRLRGSVSAEATACAWSDVVERHEILRTVFPQMAGMPVQRVLPSGEENLRFSFMDVEADADLVAAEEEAVREPFDLESDVPARLTLLSSGEEHALLFAFHHIAIDESSVPLLLEDFAQAYSARLEGRVNKWDSTPARYAPFTLSQRRRLGSQDDPDSPLTDLLDYWSRTLAGAPATTAIAADGTPKAEGQPGARIHRSLSADVLRELRGVAVRENCSVFMVVHAALVAVLARHGAGGDVVVGCPTSGRGDASVERTVGYFVNPVVLRVRVPVGVSLRELLPRVVAVDIEAFERAEVPFERVVEAVNPRRVAGRNPLFQISLTQTYPVPPPPRVPGAEVRDIAHVGTGSAVFDLAFTCEEREADKGLTLALDYREDLFRERTADRLLDALVDAVGGLLDDDRTPIVPVLREEEPPTEVERVHDGDPAVVAQLCHIFGQVLSRESVTAQDDFFELGGHSLLATRLTARVRESLDVDLSIRDLYATATPDGLAALIAARR